MAKASHKQGLQKNCPLARDWVQGIKWVSSAFEITFWKWLHDAWHYTHFVLDLGEIQIAGVYSVQISQQMPWFFDLKLLGDLQSLYGIRMQSKYKQFCVFISKNNIVILPGSFN